MVENKNSNKANLKRTHLLKNYGIPLMKELDFHPSIIEFTEIVIKVIEKLENKILDISSNSEEYNPRAYIMTRNELIPLLSIEEYNSRNEYQTNYTDIKAIIKKALEKSKDGKLDVRRLFENIVSQSNKYLEDNFNTFTNEIDGKYIEEFIPEWLKELDSKYPNSKMPKVFLSYAYIDQPHTISLFKYFYDNGIYLYVDWMHNGKLKTIKLKDKLINELESSNQILFLRTLNSELKLRGGNNQIRQWCAWEIGCFDYINRFKNNKFYINHYINNTSPHSDMIDGYNVMTGIIPNVGIS